MEIPAVDDGLRDEVFGSLVEFIRSVVRNDRDKIESLSGSEIDLSYHMPGKKLAKMPGFVHPVWICLEDFGSCELAPGWKHFSESENARWCALDIIVAHEGRRIIAGKCAFVMKKINNVWRFVQIRFCTAE